MGNNLTTCPNCGFKFDGTEALQKHLEIELKKRLEIQEKENVQKIQTIKNQLLEEKRKFEQEEKKKMWAIALQEAQKRTEEKSSAEVLSLKEELERKQKLIIEGQKKELELLRKENELKNQQDQLKIEVERQLLKKTNELIEQTKKQKEEEFALVKKEYETKLENQMNLVKEMQRKASQGSMQLQGEVQELALEDLLERTFIYDHIEEVPKGVRGADAIQTVKNEFGQDCGKIIFESKRTDSFNNNWIEKLKKDQREVGAELAVIVTKSMPKDLDRFGEKDGVYICSFEEVKSLVFVLREILIRSHHYKSLDVNKTDKMSLLYNFLTSDQFKHQMEAIVDGFSNLKTELDKEKRVMQRVWKEREIQIEKVIENTIDMYASIKGIAGNSVASIKSLELPEEIDQKNSLN